MGKKDELDWVEQRKDQKKKLMLALLVGLLFMGAWSLLVKNQAEKIKAVLFEQLEHQQQNPEDYFILESAENPVEGQTEK